MPITMNKKTIIDYSTLNVKECRIIVMLCQGLPAKQIAHVLKISMVSYAGTKQVMIKKLGAAKDTHMIHVLHMDGMYSVILENSQRGVMHRADIKLEDN